MDINDVILCLAVDRGYLYSVSYWFIPMYDARRVGWPDEVKLIYILYFTAMSCVDNAGYLCLMFIFPDCLLDIFVVKP